MVSVFLRGLLLIDELEVSLVTLSASCVYGFLSLSCSNSWIPWKRRSGVGDWCRIDGRKQAFSNYAGMIWHGMTFSPVRKSGGIPTDVRE